jgi:hypothetical protein
MPERRYSRYKQAEVWAALYQQQTRLGVEVHDGTVQGNSVLLTRSGVVYRAVVLARSSDWYYYSLNCVERWHHGISAVVCGTHDSCLDIPVLALDALRWYDPQEMRVKQLTPQHLDERGRAVDAFEHRRKSQYGHNILIGALMCGRADALQRLASLPPSTQLRIETQLRRLRLRRPGRPLRV